MNVMADGVGAGDGQGLAAGAVMGVGHAGQGGVDLGGGAGDGHAGAAVAGDGRAAAGGGGERAGADRRDDANVAEGFHQRNQVGVAAAESQRVAGGKRLGAGHRVHRRHAVHFGIGVVDQGIGQGGVVGGAGIVLDSGGTQRNAIGRGVHAVAVAVAGLHGILEYQRCGTAAGSIRRRLARAADIQCQGRRAAGYGHGLVEIGGDVHGIARLVSRVAGTGAVGDGDRGQVGNRIDGNGCGNAGKRGRRGVVAAAAVLYLGNGDDAAAGGAWGLAGVFIFDAVDQGGHIGIAQGHGGDGHRGGAGADRNRCRSRRRGVDGAQGGSSAVGQGYVDTVDRQVFRGVGYIGDGYCQFLESLPVSLVSAEVLLNKLTALPSSV